MTVENKMKKGEYRIMQLRTRAVKYKWNKRREPFTKLMTIPWRLRFDINESPTRDQEIALWKVFRKWEIVQEMRALLPNRRINSNLTKLDLIRLWVRLRDPTIYENYDCELFLERYYGMKSCRHWSHVAPQGDQRYIPRNQNG